MDIHFRLVDGLEELAIITKEKFNNENYRISGFFQLHFDAHKEGCYYHENPLQFEESGSELIDYWFNVLLDVVILLENGKTDYVAFKEIDTTKKWVEFKKDGSNIILNVAIDDNERISELIITTPFNEFSYVEPLNSTIEFSELKSALLKSVHNFLKELQELNSELCETERIKEITNKLEYI